jgi:hypothetical protein
MDQEEERLSVFESGIVLGFSGWRKAVDFSGHLTINLTGFLGGFGD